MNSKQNAVFWIGLILIVANFWVSGQSSTFWKTFTVKDVSKNSPTPKTPQQGIPKSKGGAKFSRDPSGNLLTTIPGVCPSGFTWNSRLKICQRGP